MKEKIKEKDKNQAVQCQTCQSWWETNLTVEETGNSDLRLIECPIC